MLDQLIIPNMIFPLFSSCFCDIVLILLGEILSWSLMEVYLRKCLDFSWFHFVFINFNAVYFLKQFFCFVCLLFQIFWVRIVGCKPAK